MVRWCRACPAGALLPEIARRLGPAGCAELERMFPGEASGWEQLTLNIPYVVSHLLEVLKRAREECARDCKSMSLRMDQLKESEEEAYNELEKAWKEYHEVRAQKEALHEALVAMKR